MNQLADIVGIRLVILHILLAKKCAVLQILMQASVLDHDVEREQAFDDLSPGGAHVRRRLIPEEQPDHVHREHRSSFMEREIPIPVHAVGIGTEAAERGRLAGQSGSRAPQRALPDHLGECQWRDDETPRQAAVVVMESGCAAGGFHGPCTDERVAEVDAVAGGPPSPGDERVAGVALCLGSQPSPRQSRRSARWRRRPSAGDRAGLSHGRSAGCA